MSTAMPIPAAATPQALSFPSVYRKSTTPKQIDIRGVRNIPIPSSTTRACCTATTLIHQLSAAKPAAQKRKKSCRCSRARSRTDAAMPENFPRRRSNARITSGYQMRRWAITSQLAASERSRQYTGINPQHRYAVSAPVKPTSREEVCIPPAANTRQELSAN